MKKFNKKGIVKLIILIILIIMQIKAFDNSRANKLTYITAKIVDSGGLLSDENSTLIAINEGDNGMAITLPDFINTKKISKYIVTKKEIIETENTEENTVQENVIPEESSSIEEEVTVTEEVAAEDTVEMLPGDKIYLTQEEIDNLAITLTVQYDTLEVEEQTLYNKTNW